MNKTHILIIDGDKESARAMSDLLESHSYKADATYNNVDALAQINHFPDLILLDRTLPDIDGLEICKAVRSNRRLQHISIIVLSEQDVSAEKVKGLQQGADDYVIKACLPFSRLFLLRFFHQPCCSEPALTMKPYLAID